MKSMQMSNIKSFTRSRLCKIATYMQFSCKQQHTVCIFQLIKMVLHAPDIDNSGERDAVESLLSMRNSSRMSSRDDGSNTSENNNLYSPYFSRFASDEDSSIFPKYSRFKRSSKLSTVRQVLDSSK